jgi:hypothetical protein
MLHLITRIDPTDEFDKTCFGILNVTQGLINRLKEYREITDRTPKADHVVFDEDCFFFAGDDFLSKYIDSLLPDIKSKVEDLNVGDFFATTEYRIARQHVEAAIELASVNCESVRFAKVPRRSAPTFYAYNEYSSAEYWFQVSIEYLENALRSTELVSTAPTHQV